MRSAPGLALLLLPGLVLAEPGEQEGSAGCSIDVLTRDRLVRSGDVEVGPSDPVRSVVSLDGRVRVKAGAVVEDVVALGGDVIVEEGAVVRGDATAVGGKLDLAPGAKIHGSATSVGEGITSGEGAVIGGNRASIRADVNGTNLVALVVAGLGSLLGSCDVAVRSGE